MNATLVCLQTPFRPLFIPFRRLQTPVQTRVQTPQNPFRRLQTQPSHTPPIPPCASEGTHGAREGAPCPSDTIARTLPFSPINQRISMKPKLHLKDLASVAI
jgi:hypothetical protein